MGGLDVESCLRPHPSSRCGHDHKVVPGVVNLREVGPEDVARDCEVELDDALGENDRHGVHVLKLAKVVIGSELCDRDLPPDAADARICSYECTFCADCVDAILHNVCPNCGGGFEPRPIRPRNEWRPGVGLTKQPASTERRKLKYDRADIAEFSTRIRDIPPQDR